MRGGLFSLVLAASLILSAAGHADDVRGAVEQPASGDDLLCAHAPSGTVETVPSPFDRWLVLVCAPQSQALVPLEGTIWFAHGGREPVSILALPPGATPMLKSDGFDPRYGVRFTAFFAAEARDEKRAHALKLLDTALAGEQAPHVERIFQLDAVSSIYDMRYNIYFYIADNRPRMGLVCIDECRQALLIDILTVSEAAARITGR